MRKLFSRGRKRWSVIVPVALVLVAVIGTGAWAMTRSSGTDAATVTYRSVTVSTGTIKETVSASGTVAAAVTQDASFSASGEVTAVDVVPGQKVVVGQRLATISSASLTSQVAQQKSTLAAAEAKLDTDTTAGASAAQLSSDSAEVAVAQSGLADAQTALAGATLTATTAGTVTVVNVTVGEQLSGTSGSGGASTGSTGGAGSTGSTSSTGGTGGSSSSSSTSTTSADVEVVSTGSYLVNATVDATDVANVKKGDQATITVTGLTTPVFGTVSSVGVVASTSSGSATFPVVVAVTGSPSGLYAGSSATLVITYKQLSNVLVVPTLAITRNGTASTVTKQVNGTKTVTTITTGLSSGGSTQVLTGLADGDTVVVAVRAPTGAGTGTRTGTGTGGFGGFGGEGPPTGGGAGPGGPGGIG